MLAIEAPAAIDWEARLSLPTDQPVEMAKAMGFEPGAASLKTVGGFRNISAWSLWPGATVLVVGGLLALAFQWRTLGRTFASIFTSFGGKRNAAKGPLDHIEIPMTWFVFGFVFTGILAVAAADLDFLDSVVDGRGRRGADVLPRRRGRAGGGGNRHQSHRRARQSDPTHLRRAGAGQHHGEPHDGGRDRRRRVQLQRHRRKSQGRPHGRREPAEAVHRPTVRRPGRRPAGRAGLFHPCARRQRLGRRQVPGALRAGMDGRGESALAGSSVRCRPAPCGRWAWPSWWA